jgi:hypothetical protein
MTGDGISVRTLTKLLNNIRRKRIVPEKEIRNELNNSQFRLFVSIIMDTTDIIYNVRDKTFEVVSW